MASPHLFSRPRGRIDLDIWFYFMALKAQAALFL
jgi:hypothetical protein